MSGLLARILDRKYEELRTLTAPAVTRTPRGKEARAALAVGDLVIVAEIKPKSPSAGVLSSALSPRARAAIYAKHAAMISVLCDETFFGGSYAMLSDVREVLPDVPLLAKEFIVSEVQLDVAAAAGADSALLIARIAKDLEGLIAACDARGLLPLVEVTDDGELERALDCGATAIGVNARDLDTLAMDGERARQVLERIPPGIVAVAFSGVSTAEDVAPLAVGRPDAVLVGEALMRLDDPAPLLLAMARAGRKVAVASPVR